MDLARTAADLHGAAGMAWATSLPRLVTDYGRRWLLEVGEPLAGLAYGFAAAARRADGSSAVLKLRFPDLDCRAEIAALRHFDGNGAARLLAADPARGALLLERLEPGTPLAAVEDDEQATLAAAGVMRLLWKPPPAEHAFPTVADWAEGVARLRARYDSGSGPLPERLVARAERLFAELSATQAATVLLHGDLHHDNVLAAERAPWLAIDPHGVIGEPAYEVGALLRNPLPRLLRMPRPERVLARRLDLLAEALGLERARLHGWSLAQAVLSAAWSLEDHGDEWQPTIACAELLAALKA